MSCDSVHTCQYLVAPRRLSRTSEAPQVGSIAWIATLKSRGKCAVLKRGQEGDLTSGSCTPVTCNIVHIFRVVAVPARNCPAKNATWGRGCVHIKLCCIDKCTYSAQCWNVLTGTAAKVDSTCTVVIGGCRHDSYRGQ